MTPASRKCPLELRERAVRMYRAAEPKPVIRRMAEEIGVHHEDPRGWIRQAEAEAGERDDRLISPSRATGEPRVCNPRVCSHAYRDDAQTTTPSGTRTQARPKLRNVYASTLKALCA
ncbi:transposase [Streptomyces sp. NPDC085946]|uniref:transposase n=1 Tax=Streptomyces sp. NPDC085946 TaxID=3365744 RepID=UPI0037D363ED